ncbi:ectomycorrhiza-regulated esterase [Calocera viscosa TUFC12733]|uniref:Ectomycorrhiza-regulated esterase n=1 Tax=Calocera viscosa (strain TUFC12733) TaxID=1330018 RepID=A0A167G4A9_CALVF|nr:ectomycorrhiza-regulated esterase [Calocera viscosa TUFC12733]
MHSSTHRIPFPGHEEWYIEGTLDQKGGADVPTSGWPIALILHGSLGHRDYLYQRTLSPHLPLDTFRFDFRSNARSPGPSWQYAGFAADVADVHAAAAYLRERFGYRIVLVVGHSRGSVVGLRWVCEDTTERRARGLEGEVKGYANVSGRWRMGKIRDITQHMLPDFQTKGYHDWHVRVASKPVVARVHAADIDRFAAYDSTIVEREFPLDVHVLTVHGMRDQVVPTYDGIIYSRVFESRRERGGTGRSTLHLIEESDHNHKGHYQEVNDTIVRWWRTVEDGTVQGGMAPAWHPPGEASDGKSKL